MRGEENIEHVWTDLLALVDDLYVLCSAYYDKDGLHHFELNACCSRLAHWLQHGEF